ncbi:exodeoxyribonuclease III [Salmonella enterica subsp. enterica serovar Enteritidis]|nr:exodeoxyribonuclease III [Salmonella enterica subsp. enterica]EBW2353159.1 exodeoxyribonuclease III [Salmonella enterica subsp. enterica serovar Enteritidis]
MLTIATWNINSVRLRMPLVERFLTERKPDVLCLQETKCPDELFPFEPFIALGYPHIAVHGQKGYHGVATISRFPLEVVEKRRFFGVEDSRHLSMKLHALDKTVLVHNFYVPAGGDEPDVEINPKFKHKLGFVDEMRAIRAGHDGESASILVGDLNIAPLEHDVWSHKQLLKVVSHTPVETTSLEAMRTGGEWADLLRHGVPDEQKIYTWWSYRSANWEQADKGRRLDHIWSSPNLVPHLRGIDILREARGWERPSDHVPVVARFAL